MCVVEMPGRQGDGGQRMVVRAAYRAGENAVVPGGTT